MPDEASAYSAEYFTFGIAGNRHVRASARREGNPACRTPLWARRIANINVRARGLARSTACQKKPPLRK